MTASIGNTPGEVNRVDRSHSTCNTYDHNMIFMVCKCVASGPDNGRELRACGEDANERLGSTTGADEALGFQGPPEDQQVLKGLGLHDATSVDDPHVVSRKAIRLGVQIVLNDS